MAVKRRTSSSSSEKEKPKSSRKKKGSSSKSDAGDDPFAAALKGKDKLFNRARKTKAGSGFDNDKLIETLKLQKQGKMVRVVAKMNSSKSDADEEGNGRVNHTFTIVRGPAEGQMVSIRRVVKDYFKKDADGEDTDEVSYSEEQVMETICQDYQRLIEAETDNVTKEDVKEMAAVATKEKPVVALKLKRKGEYVNVEIVGTVDEKDEGSDGGSDGGDDDEGGSEGGSDGDDDDAGSDGDDDDDEDGSEGDADSDGGSDGGDDEEDETPAKGNEVIHRKKHYLVFKVDTSGKKVDLADMKTKKVVKKAIAWDDIELVYEDDEDDE